MKPFTRDGRNVQEGQKLILPQCNEEDTPLGLSFEGGVAGARTLSRRQALGLIGGSLAGVSLLSLGLAAPAKGFHTPGSQKPGWPKAHVRGPGTSFQPLLSSVRQGNWFDLTLEWRIVCDPQVVNHTLRTNWVLKEEDTSADDTIAATVEPHLHSAWSPEKVFIPSRANPSNPLEVSFRETIGWHRDDLDTELGGEELYAWVSVADTTANSVRLGVPSTQQPLSP
jgi:hypothetical protein